MSDYTRTPGKVVNTGNIRMTGRRLQRVEEAQNISGSNMEIVRNPGSTHIHAPSLNMDHGWGVSITSDGRGLRVGAYRSVAMPALLYLGLSCRTLSTPDDLTPDETPEAGGTYLLYVNVTYGAPTSQNDVGVAYGLTASADVSSLQQNGSVSVPIAWIVYNTSGNPSRIVQLQMGPIVIPLRWG